ncbi:hypothetical protein ACS5PU_21090 [Pedobacter sp. GSP4]|uniref:hypothetical protein n=1 Tax=Pedobacter sp. GSP4 TaxID=3453716 RepID=UPI003EEDE68F
MDINNFGVFNSNTWGTVSDWAMVIVTMLTAFYLIRTFNAQYEIKKIELWKYLETIKPIYTVELIHTNVINSKSNYDLDLSFVISNTNGVAKNVTLDIFSTFEGWKFYIDSKIPLELPIREYSIVSTMISATYSSEKSGAACTFKFEFSDNVGNLYRQMCVFSAMNSNLDVKTSIPIMQNKPIFKV